MSATINSCSKYNEINISGCMCSICVICIYLCSIQCIHDFGEDWVIIIVIFLADELDVSQLCKVEVPLLLQPLYSKLQIEQL